MSNNKQHQKSFANIISKEDYKKLDEDDLFSFEEKNKINVLSQIPDYLNITLFNNIKDKGDNKAKKRFEKKLNKYEDDKISWNYFNHLNPLLVEEIFNSFLEFIKSDDPFQYTINDIKIEITTAFNDENKKTIIENYLYKYTNEFNNIYLLKTYFLNFENIHVDSEEFTALLKTIIAANENIYVDFITKGHKMDYYKYDVLKDFKNLKTIDGILKYLKNYKKEHLSNLLTTSKLANNKPTINDKKQQNIINFKSDTFKYTYSEDLFMHLLKSTGVIKQDNTIKPRKLLPICDAIYTTDFGMGQGRIIFKDTFTKKEFADFLRLKFKAEINNENKFSTGNNYTTAIKNLIDIYIKGEK